MPGENGNSDTQRETPTIERDTKMPSLIEDNGKNRDTPRKNSANPRRNNTTTSKP